MRVAGHVGRSFRAGDERPRYVDYLLGLRIYNLNVPLLHL